jgi:hypothetical protein
MRTDVDSTQHRHTRRPRLWVTLASALTLSFAGLLVSAGTASAASQAVTVMPATGLTDGQTVTVSGTGWTPNTGQLMIVQCPAQGASQNTCNIAGGKLFQKADGQGRFSVQMTVKISFGSTDCAKVQCQIAVNEGTDPNGGKNAVADISFGQPATTPVPAPSDSSTASQAAGATSGTTESPSLGVGGVAVTATSEPLPVGANAGQAPRSSGDSLTITLAALAVALFVGGILIELRRARATRRH